MSWESENKRKAGSQSDLADQALETALHLYYRKQAEINLALFLSNTLLEPFFDSLKTAHRLIDSQDIDRFVEEARGNFITSANLEEFNTLIAELRMWVNPFPNADGRNVIRSVVDVVRAGGVV